MAPGIPPTVTTDLIDTITGTSAICHANLVAVGNSPMVNSGVCWSTSANPTDSNSKTTDGPVVVGTYTTTLTGLIPGTHYHARAYARNMAYGGTTSYGADTEFDTPAVPVIPKVLTGQDGKQLVLGSHRLIIKQ